MKVVLLAGGLGSRISEETNTKPKPMIEIGGKPILWHLMKIYSHYGLNEFIICCGYKGYVIKEFFANYFLHTSDVTIDLQKNSFEVHHQFAEPWKVTLVDTGESTMTGGRLLRIKSYIGEDDSFCFNYGDGLADVNINELINFHYEMGLDATMTAVHPQARFGSLEIKENKVIKFKEKPKLNANMINGGYFVLRKKVLDLVDGDHTIWEDSPLETLVKNNNLAAFTHQGFWQPMDTLREKNLLEELWKTPKPPWKVWR
jgi:glucose-1-phosphate cytidylyltransferase